MEVTSNETHIHCEVIGRRQTEDRNTLAFIVQCQSQQGLWRGRNHTVYRTLEQFHLLHGDLAKYELSRDFRLIPELRLQKILSFDLEDLEYLQRKLQIYLDSLTSRADILDSLIVRDWLRLPTSLDSPPIKPMAVSEFQAHSHFTATCFSRNLTDGILVVGFGDIGANSSFNVWNLLDGAPKGAFVVIPMTDTGLEGTMVTFTCPDEVTTCILLRHGELFLGLRNGEVVWTHLSNLQEGGQWKSEIVDQIKMHGASVRGMAALEREDLVFSISVDNCLRTFGPRHGKIEMLGGGSLRARLQNIHLTQVAVDETNGEVYLGTDSNRVLIYHLEGPKPVYLNMILTRGVGPIDCVQMSETAVFIGDGSELESLSHGKKLVGPR